LNNKERKTERKLARSHGLVVKGDNLQSRDCGFESRCHKLDGCKRCYSYYIIKKITKIKVAKWGTPKKKNLKDRKKERQKERKKDRKKDRKKERKKVPR
jgi:hypothetical protein